MSSLLHLSRSLPTALGLSLSLGLVGVAFDPEPARAQTSPRETSPSTGSGEGTGTGTGLEPGTSSSPSRTSTLDPLRPGVPSGATGMPSPPRGGQQRVFPPPRPPFIPMEEDPRVSGDRAPGVRDPAALGELPTLPTDTTLGQPMPSGLESYGIRHADPAKLRAIREELIPDARAIADPADRCLAFDRVARSKILYDEWDDAFVAITEGGRAAVLIQDETLRDARLLALASTSIILAEELSREATVEDYYSETLENRPGRSIQGRLELLERARRVMAHAGDIVAQIRNTNFESFTLAQLAENQALNSQAVARYAEKVRLSSDGSDEGTRQLLSKADALLAEAETLAWRCTLPIWRDQSLARVVASASASGQFDRGLRIARRIPRQEARADALVRLAESMARAEANDRATRTYEEAAAAVASIPLQDPRAMLAAVLLDSLLAVGRFDDARTVASLILDPRFRPRALGAVARAMGERGLADSALAWIDREIEPDLRDRMRREVSEGLGLYLQKNRPNPQNIRLGPVGNGDAFESMLAPGRQP